MDVDLETFLREASRKYGVSGYEGQIGEYIAEMLRPLADSVRSDHLQNVIACAGTEGPRVMISAHMDEIGLIVGGIEDDGSIRVHRLGYTPSEILPAHEVEVLTKEGPIFGVVSAKPPHLLSREERSKPVEMDTLCIDVGFPAEKVRRMVRIGDPIAMVTHPRMLENGIYSTKTLDNRAGVAAMLVAAEELKKMRVKSQVFFVASAQEESHTIGTKTAGYQIDPDYAIVIDVCFATQTDCAGIGLFPLDTIVIDRGPYIHRQLGRMMEETAKKYHIPFDVQSTGGSTMTDLDYLHTVRKGIPSALLSIPIRYMHTSVESARLETIRDAGRLMALMIAEMAEKWGDFEWF